MKSMQSVPQRRMMSWITLVIFLLFSILPSPGYAAVVQTVGEDGRLIYTTDSDTVWEVGNFDQAAGTVWDFNLSQGNLLVNVNGGSATTWGGTTNIFGGLLGLFNPHGIHFTDSSRINLTNASFIGAAMNAVNGMNFDTLNLQGGGYLLNEGVIKGGDVTLLGRAVENRGRVEAPLNRITLAAGEAMTVGLSGDNLVSVVVDEAVTGEVRDFAGNKLTDQLKNSGTMTGNRITLDAKGVDQVFEKAINLSGEIQAVGIVEGPDGVIELIADGDIINDGTLRANTGRIEIISGGAVENAGALWALQGVIDIEADGAINTSGLVEAGTFIEAGYTFGLGGTFHVGESFHHNADGALTTYSANVNLSGVINDTGNIVIDPGVVVTLDGLTTFNADSDLDGVGAFLMDATASIVGGGFNLTLVASDNSDIGIIQNVNTFTIGRQESAGNLADVVFSGSADDDIDVVTFRTISPTTTAVSLSKAVGDGTTTPRMIYDITQLQAMQDNLDWDYELANNIDASSTATWNSNAGFNPVGDNVSSFTGNLDGQTHTISSLSINRPAETFVGLIGHASGNSIIDVGLINVDVTGNLFVGGLAGYSSGTMIGTYTTGTVSGASYVGGLTGVSTGSISAAHSESNVSASGGYAGGLLGYKDGAGYVANSYAAGDVSGGSYTGGLVGGKDGGGGILNSYASGEVSGTQNVGGLVGSVGVDGGNISNSYAIGDVAGTQWVGGLVGYHTSGSITNSYAAGEVTGTTDVGGLAGFNNLGLVTYENNFWDSTLNPTLQDIGNNGNVAEITAKSTIEIQTGSTFTDENWDFNGLWKINNGEAPHLVWQNMEGSGSASNPWQIDTANELQFMSYYLTYDDPVDGLQFVAQSYQLSADVDASDTVNWNGGLGFDPVTFIDSTLDGNNYTITGLTINRVGTSKVGLFGHVSFATVQNLNIVDAYMAGGDWNGGLGGIFGYVGNDSDISNVSFSGTLEGGGGYVGGLVGYGGGTITNSHFSGTATSPNVVGGLAGSIGNTAVSNSYFEGALSGNSNGFSGVLGGTVTNSYYNADEVTFNGVNKLLPYGIYDAQFDEWMNNNQSLDINDYYSSAGGYYLIDSINGFQNFLAFSTMGTGYKFKLANDIDFSGVTDFYVPYLNLEEFNGDGKAISNFTINLPDFNSVGFFGQIAGGAVVTDLGLVNVDVEGSSDVGGLAGGNSGTITNSYTTGVVRGSGGVGGLVGGSIGTITHSYSTATVIADGNSVGGLAGFSSYGAAITDSYASGSVTGDGTVGGLVGDNFLSTVTNSFASGNVSGNANVGAFIGAGVAATVTNSFSTGIVTLGGTPDSGSFDGSGSATLVNSFYNTDETVFLDMNHSVYDQGGLNPWDIYDPDTNPNGFWQFFDGALPHFEWEGFTPAPDPVLPPESPSAELIDAQTESAISNSLQSAESDTGFTEQAFRFGSGTSTDFSANDFIVDERADFGQQSFEQFVEMLKSAASSFMPESGTQNSKEENSSTQLVKTEGNHQGDVTLPWRDFVHSYYEADHAQQFKTQVEVLEGLVYVVDGAHNMNAIKAGLSKDVFFQTPKPGIHVKGEIPKPGDFVPMNQLTHCGAAGGVCGAGEGINLAESRVLSSSLKEVFGQVNFRIQGQPEWRSAGENQTVLPGMEIRTGNNSSAKLKLNGGKVGEVAIGPNSLFRVSELIEDASTGNQTTLLDLALGQVTVKVQKLKGKSKFEVRTPTAITGVRGTIFRVTVEPKEQEAGA